MSNTPSILIFLSSMSQFMRSSPVKIRKLGFFPVNKLTNSTPVVSTGLMCVRGKAKKSWFEIIQYETSACLHKITFQALSCEHFCDVE